MPPVEHRYWITPYGRQTFHPVSVDSECEIGDWVMFAGVSCYVAGLMGDGDISVANVRRIRSATRLRCPECKRNVLEHHVADSSIECGGDHRETCFNMGCGLNGYDWIWRSGVRAYLCYGHYTEWQRASELRNERAEETRRAQYRLYEQLQDSYDESFSTRPNDIEEFEMESLLGDEFRPPPDSQRVLMNVHPVVRERLRRLLMLPEMRGVGYSAFINRACEVAERQIDARSGQQQEEERVAFVPLTVLARH